MKPQMVEMVADEAPVLQQGPEMVADEAPVLQQGPGEGVRQLVPTNTNTCGVKPSKSAGGLLVYSVVKAVVALYRAGHQEPRSLLLCG